MSHSISLRLALAALLAAAVLPVASRGHSQASVKPVAEAACRAREQKKAASSLLPSLPMTPSAPLLRTATASAPAQL
jgi:hypothetical protein